MLIRRVESPWGALELLAEDGQLQAVMFADSAELAQEPGSPARQSTGRRSGSAADRWVLEQTERQLEEYVQGQRQQFELPLLPRGTDFQRRIWTALASQVAFGQTVSYGGLAALAGRARAVRAVGNAVGRNPWVIVVPCHRVLASGGLLGGFGSGLDRKRGLLRHEHIGWREP